jgi:hypothetical protein
MSNASNATTPLAMRKTIGSNRQEAKSATTPIAANVSSVVHKARRLGCNQTSVIAQKQQAMINREIHVPFALGQ